MAVNVGNRAGGVVGNARLTGSTGTVLLVLLAAEGVTVPFVRGLLSAHVFIGAMLIPPVGLKLGSTGYRFFRYYNGDHRYRAAGPPVPVLRVVAPLVVIASVVLLASGVGLLFLGTSRHHELLQIHKLSFLIWFAVMTAHVLGHLVRAPSLALDDLRQVPSSDGRTVAGVAWRRSAIAASLVAGVAFGVYAIAQI